MTRDEEIKEAYQDYLGLGSMLQSNPWFAFKAGAEWADKNPINVWRNTNEEPKHGSKVLIYCLNECGEMYCEFYHCINFNELSWKEAVDIFNIKKWIYVEDLLP